VRYSEHGDVIQVLDQEVATPPLEPEGKNTKVQIRENGADSSTILPTPEEVYEYDDAGNWIKCSATVKTQDIVTVCVTRRVIHYY
jgi:hypothetical protein